MQPEIPYEETKTALRSTMTEEHLSALVVSAIHYSEKDITDDIMPDICTDLSKKIF